MAEHLEVKDQESREQNSNLLHVETDEDIGAGLSFKRKLQQLGDRVVVLADGVVDPVAVQGVGSLEDQLKLCKTILGEILGSIPIKL